MGLLALAGLVIGCGSPRSRYSLVGSYGPVGPPPGAYEAYLQGRKASVEGRHDDAIAWFRQAAHEAPDELEPRVAIAEELMAAGRLEEARRETDELLRRWPQSSEVWKTRGRLFAHVGDVRGAVTAFLRAIDRDPDDEHAYLLAAAGQRQLGDARSAEATYRRLLARRPRSAEGHFRLGQALLVRHAYSEAERHMAQAVALDGDLLDARIALADVYRKTDRPELAARALRDAFDRSGEDPRVGRRLVVVLLESGDREGALELLSLLDGDWRSARTRVEIGYVYLSIRRPDKAVQTARAVLASDPTFHAARVLEARALAQQQERAAALEAALRVPADAAVFAEARALASEILAREGKLDDALRLVDAALATQPEEPTLIVARASLYEKRGDVSRAREILDEALKRRPREEELLYARAQLEDRTGDADRAVALLEPLLIEDPDNVAALNFIGYSWANRGVRLAEAERLLRRAAELAPDDGYVLDSLGWVLFRRGKIEEAARVLSRADRLSPDEPEILLHLGEVCLRRGETRRARDLWHRALTLDPDDRVRARLEERVRTLEAAAAP